MEGNLGLGSGQGPATLVDARVPVRAVRGEFSEDVVEGILAQPVHGAGTQGSIRRLDIGRQDLDGSGGIEAHVPQE